MLNKNKIIMTYGQMCVYITPTTRLRPYSLIDYNELNPTARYLRTSSTDDK